MSVGPVRTLSGKTYAAALPDRSRRPVILNNQTPPPWYDLDMEFARMQDRTARERGFREHNGGKK